MLDLIANSSARGFVHALVMLFVANGAPIVADWVCRKRLSRPLDSGVVLADGRALFGKSKTVRGVAAAVLASIVTALSLGYSGPTGALFGALVMIGDLLTSFVKRRLGLAPSAKAPLLDHVPECVLPAPLLLSTFGLSVPEVVLLVAMFSWSAPKTAYLLHRAGLRRQPH